jgi:3-oxoacyl-[acyl-carrier-protein] synthase III
VVITASCSVEPAVLRRVAAGLAPTAAHLALNAACSGFSYAISTADALVRTGAADYVLVVAIETMSRIIDPLDLGTSIIFGDGAGAALVGPAPATEVGIGPAVWGSDGAAADLIACRDDGRLRMAGNQVFRWAVETVPGLALEVCERSGVRIDDVEVFVAHQANLRIIEAVVRKLGLDSATVATDVTTSGNTSAASVPIALRRLLDAGEAKSGQLALTVGFGAGLTYAGQLLVLP